MTATQSPGSGSVRGVALFPQTDGTVELLPHAEIVWQNTRFTEIRPLPGQPPSDAPLLLPGFVDLHCHWPQSHVRGQFSGQLLPWLREAIWPAEAAFVDPVLARAQAQQFRRDVTRAGTCGGLFFGAPFAEATGIFLQETPRGFFEGPAIMSQNAPPALLRPAEVSLAMLRALANPRVSIAPRFAPNLDAPGLTACGEAAQQTGWPVQSHLSENADELAWVRQLFPDARDYTDVYERAGLLGPRTVMAHGIHLSEQELARLAATGTLIAHCPTSNEALGSGRMPLERLRRAGVPWVLATDVGAGPSLSQLHVMQRFLATHAGHAEANACEALARASAIPGAWLAQFDADLAGLGTLSIGAPAHLVALRQPIAAHTQPEALLRSLLTSPVAAMEHLPKQVVLWGVAVP
jgi:guanine deaminase